MTKKQKLLQALKSGKAMSKKELYHATRYWNIGGGINKLRNEGYNIITKMVERNDERYGVYKLEVKQ